MGGTDIFVTLDGISDSGMTDPALMFSIDNGYSLFPVAMGKQSTLYLMSLLLCHSLQHHQPFDY